MRIINANKIDIFDLSVVRVAHTFNSTPFEVAKAIAKVGFGFNISSFDKA